MFLLYLPEIYFLPVLIPKQVVERAVFAAERVIYFTPTSNFALHDMGACSELESFRNEVIVA
jgi:hypothetical protein